MVSEEEPVRRRGCAGVFFCAMLLVGAAYGGGVGAFLWMVGDTTSAVARALADFRPKVGSKVFSGDGQLLGEFSIEERQVLRLSDIPQKLQKAVVATEDNTFYSHKGVRPDAILNAVLYALQTGRSRGGSTITMQVVRNVETLGVGLERTMWRKIHEAMVSLQVEREFTKDEILELYLNQSFLGRSAYGVEAAAQLYFGKSCRDLTLGQCATIAGLLRAPNPNAPTNNLKNAVARRNIVLGQMLETGVITQEEHDAARAEDLGAQVVPEDAAVRADAEAVVARRTAGFKAPYFVEEIRRSVLEKYEKSEVFEGGLEIYTTLDMRLQAEAERALLTALDAFDEKEKKKLEKQGKAEEFAPVAGALVCIDNRPPYRGFVRAMVGGRDFAREKYNTATQARRQPGSSIKPFVWAAAVAAGYTPSTIILDGPFSRVAPNGTVWSPKNYDAKYMGPVPIRHALERSLNIVSVKLVDQIGPPVVRSVLKRCGIPTEVEGLTIALGSPEVRVLEHCVAYSCFPNGGVRHDPVMITDIRDRDGAQRYSHRDYARSEQALDPRVAYVTLHMMRGVCTPGPGATGWRASTLKRPVGGKTGTTNGSRDAWFCGFTKEYTTVVWVGYRDNRPLGRGADYTGGRLACPIWVDFMTEALEGMPVEEFDVPPGVEFFSIDRTTGVAGGKYREAFVAGTAPPQSWQGAHGEPAAEDNRAAAVPEEDIGLLEAL